MWGQVDAGAAARAEAWGPEDRRYLANWLSEEERRVDALALRAEERRDKLR